MAELSRPDNTDEHDTPDTSGSHAADNEAGRGAAATARRVIRRAGQAGTWPYGVHPALVPGVSVDDQRRRYDTDKVVLGVVAVSIVGFVAWGAFASESLASASTAALGWVTTYFGWLFSALAALVLVFMLFIGFSKYGRIPLGLDGEQPEFSRFAWVAMLFAAGMGIGLLFFGPYEPMQYYLEPPPGTVEPETREAMHRALTQTIFHWGPQAWAMYALVGAAVAYGSYRRGRPILMSAIFTPLLGSKGTDGVAGRVIDIFAIIATLFGTAASLGIGALQIGRGLQIVSGMESVSTTVLVGIATILSIGFIVSAVSGIARGIRILSNINMVFALSTAFFVFLVGPTLFLVNFVPSVITRYVSDTLEMVSYAASYGDAQAEWLNAWTIFYWAWWVSWSPFVGIFIAKISRGRTLREFVSVVVLVPSLVCTLSFAIYGGTSMWMQEQGVADIASAPEAQDSLFILLDALPLAQITPLVVMFMLAVFFITSADSASVVMAILAQRGRTDPSRSVVIALGLMLAAIAILMLYIGGQQALQGMQDLIIVTALPFAVAMLVMMGAFLKDLRSDPAVIRRSYGLAALDEAVRSGVREHGDDFLITVERAPDGRGVGQRHDTVSEVDTDWYLRRDEDGNPIEYDYESGQYLGEDQNRTADYSTHRTPSGYEVQSQQGNRMTEEGHD